MTILNRDFKKCDTLTVFLLSHRHVFILDDFNMALPIVGLIYIIWSAIKIYTLGFLALLRQIFQKHKAAGK